MGHQEDRQGWGERLGDIWTGIVRQSCPTGATAQSTSSWAQPVAEVWLQGVVRSVDAHYGVVP
jgi:hypothetical protein